MTLAVGGMLNTKHSHPPNLTGDFKHFHFTAGPDRSVPGQLVHIISVLSGLKIRMSNRKIIFLFLNQNICCGYSKEPSQ